MTLLALFVCTEAEPAPSAVVLGDEDAGWLGDVEQAPPPDFDSDAVGAAVEEVLAGLLELHAGPLIGAWSVFEAEMTDDCPAWITSDDTEYWFDSCETEAGAQFEGYGTLYPYEDYRDGTLVYNGYALYTVASVVTTTGATFSGAGSAVQLVADSDDGSTLYYSYVDPGFSWDGLGSEGTWLAEGFDLGLMVYVWAFEAGGASIYATGSLGLPAGGVVEAMAFDDVLVGTDDIGVTCPEELSGTVSVLDTEGRWIDIVFDTPADLWSDFDGCDGCGTAWYQGERVGEVCVDPSVLSADYGAPW